MSPLSAFMPALFVLLWSTGFIGARYGLPHAEPLSFLAVRYACVVVLMLPVALITRAPWPQDKRSLFHIANSGLLVHGVYLGGVFFAIKNGLPAGVTALIVGLQPVITAACAGWLLHERTTSRQWLGVACGLCGVALVLSGKLHSSLPSLADGAQPLLPMILPAVVALLGITFGTLYQKRYCPGFELRTGAIIQFIPACLATSLVVLITDSWHIDWVGEFIFALGWQVVVLSFGAITLLNLLIRRGSAVSVASLFYLTPVVTALIAWAMFGEQLTPLQMFGMGIAVFGVWLARA